MTFEELITEMRGYIAEAKAEEGEPDWRDSEICMRAEDLELLLDEAQKQL